MPPALQGHNICFTSHMCRRVSGSFAVALVFFVVGLSSAHSSPPSGDTPNSSPDASAAEAAPTLQRVTVRKVGARLPNGAFVLNSSLSDSDPEALTILIMPKASAALLDLGHPNPSLAFLDRDILVKGQVRRQAIKPSNPTDAENQGIQIINFLRVDDLAQIQWVQDGAVLSLPRPMDLNYQTDSGGSSSTGNPHQKRYLDAFKKRLEKRWHLEINGAEEMEGFRFRDASVVTLPIVITSKGLIVPDGLSARVALKKHPELAVVVLRAVRALNKEPVPFPAELTEAGAQRINYTQTFEYSITIR
jgi:hypothetical protein